MVPKNKQLNSVIDSTCIDMHWSSCFGFDLWRGCSWEIRSPQVPQSGRGRSAHFVPDPALKPIETTQLRKNRDHQASSTSIQQVLGDLKCFQYLPMSNIKCWDHLPSLFFAKTRKWLFKVLHPDHPAFQIRSTSPRYFWSRSFGHIRSLVDGRMAKMMVTIMRIPPVKRYTINSKFCAAVWELKRKDNLGHDAMTGMGRVWRSMLSSAESANKYREKCYPNSWILCWKELLNGVKHDPTN